MRFNVKRYVAMIAAALALVLGGAVLTAPTAAAAAKPTCYGSKCENVNPAKTNCLDDARTIAATRAVAGGASRGHLELRYSPKCHSNWVRFTPWNGLRGYLDYVTGGAIFGKPYIWRKGVANSLRGPAGNSGPMGSGGGISYWTGMVTATGTTCFSVEVFYSEPSSSGQGGRHSLGTTSTVCVS